MMEEPVDDQHETLTKRSNPASPSGGPVPFDESSISLNPTPSVISDISASNENQEPDLSRDSVHSSNGNGSDNDHDESRFPVAEEESLEPPPPPPPPLDSLSQIVVHNEEEATPSLPVSVLHNAHDHMGNNGDSEAYTENDALSSESQENDLHSSCVKDGLLSHNSEHLLNSDSKSEHSATCKSPFQSTNSLKEGASLSEEQVIPSDEIPTQPLSEEKEGVPFQLPLIMESPMGLQTEDGSKFESELSLLEKESLDAAIEIESNQAQEVLTSGSAMEENSVGALLTNNSASHPSKNNQDSDMEVINETSSEDNDEDIDLPLGKASLPCVPRVDDDEDVDGEDKNGNEEFNKLWNSINSQPSPETVIMEEVEDEFLKDLEADMSHFAKESQTEKESETSKHPEETVKPDLNANDQDSKDDKCEDISKIAAFISETAHRPSEKEEPMKSNKSKKSLRVKLTNRVGRPPNRVGRPSKRPGKHPNRVGRPPNRPGKLRKKRGRPPTRGTHVAKPSTPSLTQQPVAAPKSKCNKIIPPVPAKLRTYESDWRKIMRMKGNYYDKFLDQIFYNSNFPGTIPYIPGLNMNVSKHCAESLSSWDLEKLQCPACPDSFLIPTSFFQHLYRKSCEIMFKCKLCDDVLTFYNRCALKVHFLSHIELDKSVSSIDIDHATLRPPTSNEDHDHNLLEPYSKELFNKDKIQCPECRLCIDSLIPHMTKKHKFIHCKVCSLILPNSCSYSSHSRIHEGLGPFICPECGDEFQTLSVFQEHVLDFCLHEHRTLIYTCPFRHKDKNANSRLGYSDILKHIWDHHLKLLYKCSYCSRAFTNEKAIHAHLKQEHSNIPEYLMEKENYTLLYKTFISKEKRIFGKKESFENSCYLVAEKQWKSNFFFKCPACHELFKEKEGLREHGIQWCRLQQSSSEIAPSHPSLFPPPKKSNALASSNGNDNFCDQENCLKCTKIFDLIQNHKHECLSNNGNEVQENGSDTERADSPTSKPLLPRLRQPNQSGDFNNFLNEESELIDDDEDEMKSVIEEPPNSPPPRKRGRKPKAKKLVETLGLDLPSSKSILHFNRLSKQAMMLGSTVLPKRMRTSLHNCSLCDYKSNDRLSFLAHIKEHSEKYEDSYLQCKECGMSFASEPSWKKHLFLIHRIRHPAPSDYVTDSAHLDEDSGDMRLVIDEERANICQVCSRSFESPKDLKKHVRGHGSSPLAAQSRKRSLPSAGKDIPLV